MNIFNKKDRRNWSLGCSVYYSSTAIEEIEKKIAAGGDVNAIFKTDHYTRTMLHWAAGSGRADVIQLLLKHGADPNTSPENDTPLMVVVRKQNLEAVRALVNAGARIDVKAYNDETPLIAATRTGAGEVVKLLVEKGADINAQMKDGNTALHFAASQGYANLAAYLIENGAKPAITNGNMNTPADVAEKEYPGLAALIREKFPGAAPKPAEVDPGWRLISPGEVAHVAVKEPIGYRVTEIFNFAARTYTHIAANLESKAESQSVKAFSELDASDTVDAAYRELVRLGGRADYADSGKKKLQAPGI